jgi:hypothetical protein
MLEVRYLLRANHDSRITKRNLHVIEGYANLTLLLTGKMGNGIELFPLQTFSYFLN